MKDILCPLLNVVRFSTFLEIERKPHNCYAMHKFPNVKSTNIWDLMPRSPVEFR
jgi:hypothetical protein